MTAETCSPQDHRLRIAAASLYLYEAETALHIARQTGVDNWIRAAADRLHEALLAHSTECGWDAA
jgi:hypothetical protein